MRSGHNNIMYNEYDYDTLTATSITTTTTTATSTTKTTATTITTLLLLVLLLLLLRLLLLLLLLLLLPLTLLCYHYFYSTTTTTTLTTTTTTTTISDLINARPKNNDGNNAPKQPPVPMIKRLVCGREGPSAEKREKKQTEDNHSFLKSICLKATPSYLRFSPDIGELPPPLISKVLPPEAAAMSELDKDISASASQHSFLSSD